MLEDALPPQAAAVDPAVPVAMAAEPPPVAAPAPEAPTPESEAAQVAEILRWVKVPGWMQKHLEKAKREREYLHTEAFAEDDDNRVTCNDLLRSIWAKLALVWPQQPEATCKPPQRIDPPQELLDLAQQEERQAAMITQAAAANNMPVQIPPGPISAAMTQWKQAQQQAEQTALTCAGVLNKMAKFSHLEETLQKAALDALSVGLVYIKVGWSEDLDHDYLGRRQVRTDSQDQFAKLRQLERDYQEQKFDNTCAEWNEMLELRAYAVRYATDQLNKQFSRDQRWQAIAQLPAGAPIPPHLLPEPERFCTGTVDLVDLENLRLDWQRVTSPSMMYLGRRTAERVWMARDEVARAFKLTPEEREKLGKPTRGSQRPPPQPAKSEGQSDVPDPAEDDLDTEERQGAEGDVAVWEVWDREQHRIYWVTRGIDRFLRTEIPDVSATEFFPYLALAFNPVSGRFMPVSDTTLGRKLQDDLNQGLTDDREARIAQYPWYAVGNNLITDDDIKAIESRRPNKVVVLTKPAIEIKQQIVKMDGEDYNGELYQVGIAQSRANLERMLGVPSEALQGQSRAKFATQVQVASDNMLAQSGRNGAAIASLMAGIFAIWKDYALVAMPAAQAKSWLGPWASWPDANREQIASGVMVEVTSAGNRGQRRQDLEDLGNAVLALNGMADSARKFAQLGWELQLPPIVKRLESALDVRLPNGLLQRMPMPLPAPPMPAGPGGAPGGQAEPAQRRGAPGGVPGDQERQGLPTAEATTGGAVPGPGGGQPGAA